MAQPIAHELKQLQAEMLELKQQLRAQAKLIQQLLDRQSSPVLHAETSTSTSTSGQKSDEEAFASMAHKPEALATADAQAAGWLKDFSLSGDLSLGYEGSRNAANINTFGFRNFNVNMDFHPSEPMHVALGLSLIELRASVPVIQGGRIDGQSIIKPLLEVKYAYADYAFTEAAHLRFGAYLTPFGVYNESLDADFKTKLSPRPYYAQDLIPVSWSQLGVQLHGRYAFAHDSDMVLHYSAYIGNGLEAKMVKNAAGVRVLDPTIANMTHQLRDRFSRNKAWGGRLGLLSTSSEHPFELGASFQTGAWDPAGRLYLRFMGLDAWYRHAGFDFRSEAVLAIQKMPLGWKTVTHKRAWYAQTAYRYLAFEPALRADLVFLDDPLQLQQNRFRVTAGLNYYFDRYFVMKGAYEWVRNQGIPIPANRYMITFTAGF